MNTDSLHISYPYRLPDSMVDTAAEAPDTANYLMMCNDTVFAPFTPPCVRKSLFVVERQSSPVPTTSLRNPTPGSDWIFGVIVILLVLMSVILNRAKIKFKDLAVSPFDYHTLERVLREYNIKPFNLYPLTIIVLAGMAISLLKISGEFLHLDFQVSDLQLFLMAFASLIVFFFLKIGFVKMLGVVFGNDDAAYMYVVNNLMFNSLLAIFSTPMLLPLFFSVNTGRLFLIIYLCFISIVFIIRTLRGFQLILTNPSGSHLYLFYYLCILEIAPILLAVKFINI